MLFGSQRETSGCALASIVRPMRNAGQVENRACELDSRAEAACAAVDNHSRHIPITNRLCAELEKLWEKSTKKLDAPVFGFGLKTGCTNKQFNKACQLAGLKQGGNPKDGLYIYSVRHTAATRLVKGQMPLQLVGRIPGHSQPMTTYRYPSADTETTAQAAAILEAFQVSTVEAQATSTELIQ